MTPLAIDQWGWSQEDAIFYLGITMAAGGILSGLCFATIGPLSKRFDERFLLLFAGIVPMIIGRVIMFPMGSEYPNFIRDFKPLVNNTNITHPEVLGAGGAGGGKINNAKLLWGFENTVIIRDIDSISCGLILKATRERAFHCCFEAAVVVKASIQLQKGVSSASKEGSK